MIRLGGSSLKERSVSYIVLAILSVAFVRLAIAYMYPRRAVPGDDLDANNFE